MTENLVPAEFGPRGPRPTGHSSFRDQVFCATVANSQHEVLVSNLQPQTERRTPTTNSRQQSRGRSLIKQIIAFGKPDLSLN